MCCSLLDAGKSRPMGARALALTSAWATGSLRERCRSPDDVGCRCSSLADGSASLQAPDTVDNPIVIVGDGKEASFVAAPVRIPRERSRLVCQHRRLPRRIFQEFCKSSALSYL